VVLFFQLQKNCNYYTIDTGDLDLDDTVLDLSIVSNLDNQTMSANTSTAPGKMATASGAEIVTKLPDKDCNVRDLSKTEQQEFADYSDEAFARNQASTSSFHNDLYVTDQPHIITGRPVEGPAAAADGGSYLGSATSLDQFQMEGADDQTSENSEDESQAMKQRRGLLEDRISSSSDEVFSECSTCNNANELSCPPSDPEKPCSLCGKLLVRLSAADIHVTERNDSGVSSTASDDESDPPLSNQSESLTTSDTDLMPDSPCYAMTAKQVSFDPACEKKRPAKAVKKVFVFEPHPLKKMKLVKMNSVENPIYACFDSVTTVSDNWDEAKSALHERLYQYLDFTGGNVEIAETRL